MKSYHGRFAPSLTGSLHLGSLVTAVGSFLQAKQHQGNWWLRFDDLDTERCDAKWANDIQFILKAHGLDFEPEVLWQSQRIKRYQQIFERFLKQGLIYPCNCTRKQMKAQNGVHLRQKCSLFQQKDNFSPCNDSVGYRWLQSEVNASFVDTALGHIRCDSNFCKQDYLVKRKDGIFSYNFAVVIDDFDQGITQVVRGQDLLEQTPSQIALFQQIKAPVPSYLHLPLALDEKGRKLSKQNHARALDANQARQNLLQALEILKIEIQKPSQDVKQILQQALKLWPY